jgi:hypothetical protein
VISAAEFPDLCHGCAVLVQQLSANPFSRATDTGKLAWQSPRRGHQQLAIAHKALDGGKVVIVNAEQYLSILTAERRDGHRVPAQRMWDDKFQHAAGHDLIRRVKFLKTRTANVEKP